MGQPADRKRRAAATVVKQLFEIIDDSIPIPSPPTTGAKTRRRRKQTKEKPANIASSIAHTVHTLPSALESGKLPSENETNEKSDDLASKFDNITHTLPSTLESANFSIEEKCNFLFLQNSFRLGHPNFQGSNLAKSQVFKSISLPSLWRHTSAPSVQTVLSFRISFQKTKQRY